MANKLMYINNDNTHYNKQTNQNLINHFFHLIFHIVGVIGDRKTDEQSKLISRFPNGQTNINLYLEILPKQLRNHHYTVIYI